MSTSDGNSTTRPLRRRQSKRFDRSGGSPIATGPTIVDTDDDSHTGDDSDTGDDSHTRNDSDTGNDSDNEDDVEVELPALDGDLSESDDAAVARETDQDPVPQIKSSAEDSTEASEPAEPPTTSPSPSASTDGVQSLLPDPTARHRSLDQVAPCGRCGHDVSIVHIEVDGNVLMMESCDNCDTRRWQLAGEPIELQQALDHVGEHTGRRR